MRLALTFAGLCLVAATATHAAVFETDSHTFPVTASHRVHLEFPVGQLKVIPSDGARVQFDLRVRCRGRSEERCQELADHLVLESEDRGGTLHLKLDNYPKWNNHDMTVIGELRVPRALAVRVEMGVGELDIEGLEGDLSVDLGVGDADIRMPRTRASDIEVEAGIGEASIRGGGANTASRGLIGSHASWSGGGGRSSVRLHVGVGDAEVRLE
jgi:hypothetical protein